MQRLRPLASFIDPTMLPAALFVVAALQAPAAQAQTAPPVPALPPAVQPTAPPEVQGGPATRAAPPRNDNPQSPSPQTDRPAPQPGAGNRGVIAPPQAADPGMTVAPPSGGTMSVIPPPGSPGSNQRVVPK